jgi:hypothetical protein
VTVDSLRPPSRLDAHAAAYKDWLHLNLLDFESGAVGLVNASLHGSPEDARSRAVGAALVHLPGAGWSGNVEAMALADAHVGTAAIGLEGVAVAVDGGRDEVLASVRLPRDGLVVDLVASATSRDLDVEVRLPLGDGWISWYAVPRLSVRGSVTVAGLDLDLSRATAYHDHNWGRWHWGADLGWEWGCFAAEAGPTFVLSRTTDRAHARTSRPLVVVQGAGRRRRTFAGRTVEVWLEGRLAAEPRRLPGALAALHQDRAAPRLPELVTVRCDDGADRVELEFRARACAQLIAADPAERGYGFVHELVGELSWASRIAGVARDGTGLGVFEYVD